jgi:hypothetical protein
MTPCSLIAEATESQDHFNRKCLSLNGNRKISSNSFLKHTSQIVPRRFPCRVWAVHCRNCRLRSECEYNSYRRSMAAKRMNLKADALCRFEVS